jgi:hypothetical protein
VELAFWLELDRLRIENGQNWLALHNTPTVSAHQKPADRVLRFEYNEHLLAVQRIRSSDASVQVLAIVVAMDLIIAPVRYWPAGLLFNELLEGLVAFFSNFWFLVRVERISCATPKPLGHGAWLSLGADLLLTLTCWKFLSLWPCTSASVARRRTTLAVTMVNRTLPRSSFSRPRRPSSSSCRSRLPSSAFWPCNTCF